MKYSIIIPVYNSERTLSLLCEKVIQTMMKTNEEYEVILVDDCSSDNSWTVIKDICSENKMVKSILLSNNFGQWMSTLAGISKSSGKYIVTIDDDLEYDPSDIKILIDEIQSKNHYVVFGMSPQKYKLQGKNVWLANLRNKIINRLWNKYVTDSFKVFRREVIFNNNQEFMGKVHFEAYINFTIHQKHVGYCEVNFNKRYEGTSNHNLLNKIKMFYRYSFDYYRFPSKGISLVSIFLLLLAMCFEYVFFKGRLNGLLLAIMSFIQISLMTIILQYIAQIYLINKKIPDYWHVESINFET